MNDKKRELLTIDLETWNEMIRENERKTIEIENLKSVLEDLDKELKSMFGEIIDEFMEEESDEDKVDEEATLKMWEEEQADE